MVKSATLLAAPTSWQVTNGISVSALIVGIAVEEIVGHKAVGGHGGVLACPCAIEIDAPLRVTIVSHYKCLYSDAGGFLRSALADAQAAKPEVKSARTTGGGVYCLLI